MKKSFTIVEFLLYIGILSIILTVFIQLFVSLTRMRTENESTSNLQQDSSYLISKFMYDIHQAKTISLPLHPPDKSNTLTMTVDGVTYTYATDSAKNLIMSDGSNDYQLNGYDTSVPQILFTRLGQNDIHDVIQINFIIESRVRNPTGNESQSYETTIGLREKP
jgi:type II secretory pathway pseudopilin PulG